ncbi:MAG TPA: glucohydrolase [Myxococcales bacterium]|nr:glucohydrolase [Deltaproteobacteria bacterium]HAA56001.1 glucohydrolase [Myxococcales bacterium]|tara:strand:+ start:5933 stop:7567 length:1635 start_codon:yes stop_codon:yes gene_type:complete
MSQQAEWWKQTTVYQIYPRSFYDSNGDGIGDIEGIIQKLDVLHALGVETLWCSPFYKSPQADFGYDIADYLSIAPEYGSMEDAERLIKEVHDRDMKIVFDMVLNHTSDQHGWFVESKSSRDNPKRDWYIWRDGKGKGLPPNNWKSMTGGSGWTYDEQTDQWYWATFLPFQPDLNYRNPEVKQQMFDIVRHWLSKGVDGFRLDIFNAIFKDTSFEDNPFSWRPLPSEDNPDGFFQSNVHTINHPDTFQFAQELRAVIDEFDTPKRFLVGEVFGPTEKICDYCGDGSDGLHLVFLFKSLHVPMTAKGFGELLDEYETHFQAPLMPTYVFGNHDRPRRDKTEEQARLQRLFQYTARGVPFLYYGEEIGMKHHSLPLKTALDPMAEKYKWIPQWMATFMVKQGILLNRDECRTPMQWDASPNAGFTTADAAPWLPLHPDHTKRHVAAQRTSDSLWTCIQRLLQLRKQHPSLHAGTLERLPSSHKDLLSYQRNHQDAPTIRVYLNFGKQTITLPTQAGTCLFSTHTPRAQELPLPTQLRPYEGVIIQCP